MKYAAVWFGLIILTLLNCQKREGENSGPITDYHAKNRYPKKQSTDPEKAVTNTGPCSPCVFTKAFLGMDDVLINGNDLVLSENDFHKFYPEKDSINSELWDCGSPFEWLDKAWMEKAYGKDLINFDGKITTFYTHHAEFISNHHNVIFYSAKTGNNRLEIKSPHIILTDRTTVAEFQKHFPKISMDQDTQDNKVVFRIPLSKDTEDSFEFYFADGRLERFKLWWLLC